MCFRTLYLRLVGAFSVVVFLVGCSEEVFSPSNINAEDLREASGIILAPIVDSVEATYTNISKYGEAVIQVSARHPVGIDTQRDIAYEFRYIDENGVALTGGPLTAEELPSIGNTAYYTPIMNYDPNPYLTGELPIGEDEEPEPDSPAATHGFRKAGVQVLVYFDDMFDDSPLYSGFGGGRESSLGMTTADTITNNAAVFLTNIFIDNQTDISSVTGSLQYSHHFVKVFFESGKGKVQGYYYTKAIGRGFVRVSASNQGVDPLHISNVALRHNSTLQLYFYVAHPRGSLTVMDYGTDAQRPTLDIDSKWDLRIDSDTSQNPANTANYNTNTGAIVYQEKSTSNFLINEGAGSVFVQADQKVHGRTNVPLELFSRRYDYIAGVREGTVTINVRFTYGEQETEEITLLVDVLNKNDHQKRITKILPELN